MKTEKLQKKSRTLKSLKLFLCVTNEFYYGISTCISIKKFNNKLMESTSKTAVMRTWLLDLSKDVSEL